MREPEAKYIGECLNGINIKTCLNLGSSTLEFRETKKHIDQLVFNPLLLKGVNVIHSDIKNGNGVDIAGDIYEEVIQKKLKSIEADLILCNNMLEHLEDPLKFSKILDDIVMSNSYLCISVPYSYPLHLDPIDNYLRPSPNEINKMFPNFKIVNAQIVICSDNYFREIIRDKVKFIKFCKRCITIFNPFLGVKKWKERHHRMLWLFKRYEITVVLLKKIQ
jgi:hypothetical protein